MSELKPHIVFLGQDGFPCGLAEIQKIRLIAKGLVHAGCEVTMINRLWILGKCPDNFTAKKNGTFEGVNYTFACGTPFRPHSFIERNFRRIISMLNEIKILWKLNRKKKIECAIISIGSFWDVIYYWIISRLFSFTIVLTITELFTQMQRIKNPIIYFDAWLIDKFAFRIVDGNLPINEFFIERIKTYGKSKPYLKVPVLVDLSRFDGIKREPKEKYLLFCGSLAYLEVIKFIINAFDYCHTTDEIFLYFVVNGSPNRFIELEKIISNSKRRSFIKVFSNLSELELSQLYVNAYALLIPLRPNLQDEARFPHKIGEYCASGRPIITTNYGEIRVYFEHCKTAMVALSYSEVEYANVIDLTVSDSNLADQVGLNGKHLAEKEFDYKLYGEKIKNFLHSLKH